MVYNPFARIADVEAPWRWVALLQWTDTKHLNGLSVHRVESPDKFRKSPALSVSRVSRVVVLDHTAESDTCAGSSNPPNCPAIPARMQTTSRSKCGPWWAMRSRLNRNQACLPGIPVSTNFESRRSAEKCGTGWPHVSAVRDRCSSVGDFTIICLTRIRNLPWQSACAVSGNLAHRRKLLQTLL